MQCTHCGYSKYVKNGKTKGIQRYKCKKCNRSFGDKVRKFTYSEKEQFLDLYLSGLGVRSTTKIIGCSHPLILRWIKQFAKVIKEELQLVATNLEDHALPDIIEIIYTRVKKGGG